jgi:hypothetical protein
MNTAMALRKTNVHVNEDKNLVSRKYCYLPDPSASNMIRSQNTNDNSTQQRNNVSYTLFITINMNVYQREPMTTPIIVDNWQCLKRCQAQTRSCALPDAFARRHSHAT